MICLYKQRPLSPLVVLIFLGSIPPLHAMSCFSVARQNVSATAGIAELHRLASLVNQTKEVSINTLVQQSSTLAIESPIYLTPQISNATFPVLHTMVKHPVSQKVVLILEKVSDLKTAATHLNKLAQSIFLYAKKCEYAIQRTLIAQIDKSIARLTASAHAEELVFHTAIIDHLLSDIHDQATIHEYEYATLKKRSPTLVSQAICDYFAHQNLEAPLVNSDWFLPEAARFVCDITLGKLYLSSANHNARIDLFFSTLKFSLQNPSKQCLDQVYNQWANVVSRCAADVTSGGGLNKALEYVQAIYTPAPNVEHLLQGVLVTLNKIDVSSSITQSLKPLWSAANALSPKSFAQLITSDYIKQIGQCAAKMACASGITGAKGYLKSLNLVSASMGQASQIAQLFIKILDQYLSTNPLFITAKGVVILGAHASIAVVQEVLAKSDDAIKIVVNGVQKLMQCKAEGFVKGTPIETAQGIKGIECITSNDKIIRYTPDGKLYECQVLATGNKTISGCVKISVGDKTIVAGLDQLFYLPQANSWVAAKNLNVAHVLSRDNGEHCSISNIETINTPTTIYYLTVQDNVYGITSDNITVHNMNTVSMAVLTTPIAMPFFAAAMPFIAVGYIGWHCLKAAGFIALHHHKINHASSLPTDSEALKSEQSIEPKYIVVGYSTSNPQDMPSIKTQLDDKSYKLSVATPSKSVEVDNVPLVAPSITTLAQNSSSEIPTTQIPDTEPTPTPEMTPEDPDKDKSKGPEKKIKDKYLKHPPILKSGPICKFTKEVVEMGVTHFLEHKKGIEHVFDKAMHNLGPLVEKCGDYVNTTREILIELSGKVHFNEKFEDLVLSVRGFEVYVRGRVMDGIPKLGTFFIKTQEKL